MSKIIGYPQPDSRDILFRVIEVSVGRNRLYIVQQLVNDSKDFGWKEYKDYTYDSRNRALGVFNRIINYR